MDSSSRSSSSFPASFILDEIRKELPTLRNEFDAVALALHLAMKSMGFRCIGCGETVDNTANDKIVPEDWNKSDTYSFRYRHKQSSMTFIIKSITIADKFLIHGLAVEDNKILSTEINPKDYVNTNSLQSAQNLYKNIEGLVSVFKKNIVAKMFPTPQDLEEPSREQSSSQTGRTSTEEDYDPLRIPGRGGRGRIPYQPNPFTPIGGDPLYPPGVSPFGIGSSDLQPPFSGGGFPQPPGNLIGPGHPGFGPFANDPYGGHPEGLPRRGGRGGHHPFIHPPGARFDPYGPPGTYFGEPDNDEPPPPGYDNMFL